MSVLKLLVRNTGEYIKVDPKDWDVVKDIHWVFKNDRVEALNGNTYEQIVGLKGVKHRCGDKYDKRRDHLIPEDQEWKYSEYHQKYIAL